MSKDTKKTRSNMKSKDNATKKGGEKLMERAEYFKVLSDKISDYLNRMMDIKIVKNYTYEIKMDMYNSKNDKIKKEIELAKSIGKLKSDEVDNIIKYYENKLITLIVRHDIIDNKFYGQIIEHIDISRDVGIQMPPQQISIPVELLSDEANLKLDKCKDVDEYVKSLYNAFLENEKVITLFFDVMDVIQANIKIQIEQELRRMKLTSGIVPPGQMPKDKKPQLIVKN